MLNQMCSVNINFYDTFDSRQRRVEAMERKNEADLQLAIVKMILSVCTFRVELSFFR